MKKLIIMFVVVLVSSLCPSMFAADAKEGPKEEWILLRPGKHTGGSSMKMTQLLGVQVFSSDFHEVGGKKIYGAELGARIVYPSTWKILSIGRVGEGQTWDVAYTVGGNSYAVERIHLDGFDLMDMKGAITHAGIAPEINSVLWITDTDYLNGDQPSKSDRN